jgi:cbb3-type cytochrome oxidase maturation protein
LNILLWLIPAALFLGLLGLGAFLWALKSGQFDDLDGAANRILFDDDDDVPAGRSARPLTGAWLYRPTGATCGVASTRWARLRKARKRPREDGALR